MKVKNEILYLASASPRRKEILSRLKLRFKVVKSSYREIPSKTAVRALILKHAKGKAENAAVPDKARWVLGADTEVYGFGKIFGKPRSEKDAFRMLTLLNGKSHLVYTGIALLDRETGKILTAVEKTRVYFKKWTPKKIQAYIHKAQVMDKAGAYGIQMKPKIVRKIKGSYSNVVGLPKEKLAKLLKRSLYQSSGGYPR